MRVSSSPIPYITRRDVRSLWTLPPVRYQRIARAGLFENVQVDGSSFRCDPDPPFVESSRGSYRSAPSMSAETLCGAPPGNAVSSRENFATMYEQPRRRWLVVHSVDAESRLLSTVCV